ncbi:BolA family protein [Chromobacterium violaceum]|uniref:Transcriptional regulator BolA n=1 Tax=Chromobacterium violaceum TaxID=536 RepID=A0AAX2MG79_CHRVL|nr:BolA/IbaG family iron-sulfur metabolism protein [Chromobacterium violaceum]MBX9269376.1 BolA/IbaG family iron-sulfur metabolism protein [Chromobacterium violaceum]OLZ85055.1 BolA family transcriptional regulator [Chromobacterium violaceum]OQS45393.1 BolA family transcriptional regulator [Chromobacterium violaceum]OQS47071.1 BolA family transcriptional regulator [Chromobacterium violaceum]QRO32083.1 BolA/IbaG family iron-sulfur metabolism protein [Chromobacterium violaceum]
MTPEQVKQYIEAGLDCTFLNVEGDGHHFYATVVSAAFEGKRLIDRHRMVKEVIASRLASNEIHALSIVKAATPDEWAKQQA